MKKIIEDEQYEFDEALDEFFDVAFQQVHDKKISFKDLESLFEGKVKVTDDDI